MFAISKQVENRSISSSGDINRNMADGLTIQRALSVGKEDDRFEIEADNIADQVMQIPEQRFIQRKCSHCEEEEKAQRKPLAGIIQKKSNHDASSVSTDITQQIESTRGNGTLMDGGTRSFMENRFGADFSDVHVHTDENSSQLSRSLHAQAFTVGKDIYFNENTYRPDSQDGKRLLAHELTHTIQQNSGQVQRVPMPDESKVQNIESYSAATRQNITYDVGFNLQTNISLFFQKGIVMNVRSGYQVTYVVKGFDPAEAWIINPMKALMLYNFNLNAGASEGALTNLTTVQHLDLTGQTNPTDNKVTGPNAMIRFTASKFDTTGKGADKKKNVQLLIEKVGNFSSATRTETAAQRRQRYATTYQITNAVPVSKDPLADPSGTMSDAEFDMVLDALEVIPSNVLSKGSHIPIHRGSGLKGSRGESAEYTQTRSKGTTEWQRRITAYGDFFTSTLPQKAYIMAHEFGHALDFRPNEGSGGKGGESLSAPKDKGSFREAMVKDGGLAKGMSEYAATKTSEAEYYAEAFSLYINQPDTLKALRPNIYDYFHAQYP